MAPLNSTLKMPESINALISSTSGWETIALKHTSSYVIKPLVPVMQIEYSPETRLSKVRVSVKSNESAPPGPSKTAV